MERKLRIPVRPKTAPAWQWVILLIFLAAGNVAGADDVYDEALRNYRAANYRTTIDLLSRKQPKDAGDFNLLGWAYLKDGRAAESATSFRSSISLDADQHDSRLGLAHASMAQDNYGEALALLRSLSPRYSSDEDFRLALADAFFRNGDNAGAAKIYRSLIRTGGPRAATARERFLDLYGIPEYEGKREPRPPAPARPASLVALFRARGDYFEALGRDGWRRVYLKGVNIGPARPGEFPSTPPRDAKTYLDWLEQIAGMNANMVRVYTILPPAFYQALKVHNERSRKKLWLLQEVWLTEREDVSDLYDNSWTEEFRKEIRHVIDLIHGQADIPYRRGHAAGIYTADVSPYVFAVGVGREVEPSVVQVTNAANPQRTRYDGDFVRVAAGNPSEVWFAEMIDLAVRYEVTKYNCQRPMTIVNWPPLDPMYHVTESDYAEEIRIRRKRGEDVSEASTGPVNDSDAVSLDIGKLAAASGFAAGLFATYHVYPYWPDFLIYDPNYPKARDREGSNRYFGYLLDLKNHHRGIPLLIGEYGLPTSWGIAHLHPEGWSNGGLSEKRQAELLTRMTRNIRDAGCAGGLVFAWQDEWWKRVSDYFTRPFAHPVERKPLWLNLLDPEQCFGIVGYRSPWPVPLLRGNPGDWSKATRLISAGAPGKYDPGTPKEVYAFSDTAFLYLRVDVEKGRGPEKAFDWSRSRYWIALNTLPGETGTRTIPGLEPRLAPGANFLIRLSGPDSGRIDIAENYNPNRWVAKPEVEGGRELWRKEGMRLRLEDYSPMEEILVEANRPRYGRDGTAFPPLFHSLSPLVYGTADPSSPGHSDRSAWHVDESAGMIEMRIPWGLLYSMDPSSRLFAAGTDGRGNPLSRESPGVAVAAMHVRHSPEKGDFLAAPVDTLPRAKAGAMPAESVPLYAWPKWDRVTYETYRKAAYRAVREIFGEIGMPGDQLWQR